ncbi:MAG: hypothetical protein Q9227_008712 [Pyrenula ochraceoflavens]
MSKDFSKDFPQGQKFKIKKPPKQKHNEVNGTSPSSPTSTTRSPSPIVNDLPDSILRHFPDGKPTTANLDTVLCKHCKHPVLKAAAKDHVAGCKKAKADKARKKKEAKEEKARAKQAERNGGDADDGGHSSKLANGIGADDDNSEIKLDTSKPGTARKSAVKNTTGDKATKTKKRKAEDGADDDPSSTKKKKKLKKDEPKAPKPPKPKGPVDVERQCGVLLANGAQCARSLTCKSHSMGAKRSVPGRSLPYDQLLQNYQKKNQARQQKAALESNAPIFDEEEFGVGGTGAGGLGGVPVDSESEKEAVMTGISKSFTSERGGVDGMRGGPGRPLWREIAVPMRRKAQWVRMKETLANALSANRGASLFAVSAASAVGGGGSESALYSAGTVDGGGGGGGGETPRRTTSISTAAMRSIGAMGNAAPKVAGGGQPARKSSGVAVGGE